MQNKLITIKKWKNNKIKGNVANFCVLSNLISQGWWTSNPISILLSP